MDVPALEPDDLLVRLRKQRIRINTRLNERVQMKDRWPLHDTDAQELERINGLLYDAEMALRVLPTPPQDREDKL